MHMLGVENGPNWNDAQLDVSEKGANNKYKIKHQTKVRNLTFTHQKRWGFVALITS